MRKLPILATTLLCSSLVLAQPEDESAVSGSVETTPAVEAQASAEEPASAVAEETASAEEPASAVAEETAPAEEPAPAVAEETVPAAEPASAVAEATPVPAADPAPVAPAVPAKAKEPTKLYVASASVPMTPEQRVSTIEENLDTLANNMESTLLGKDDAPLAVSGYMAFRVKNFDYTDISPVYQSDAARTAVDATLKMNMVLMPNSYMTLWTNMTFPFDLSGLYSNNMATHPSQSPGNTWERVLYDHNTDFVPASIDEEMNFGIDIRSALFGAYVTAGGVIWANASPLTMWERETMPRFAWQYETFEEEKTVSTYYKEKSFKPVKEGGRAFWTNRSFGGVFMNVYNMPWGLTAQALVSQPKDMDAGTRDGIRLYGGQPGEQEMSGDYDFRGDVFHGRLAKNKLFGSMTLGANYMGVFYDEGLIDENELAAPWINGFEGVPHFENNQIVSLDIKGNIVPKFYIMADVGISWDDSTKFYDVNETAKTEFSRDSSSSELSKPAFGIYVKMQDKHLEWLPTTVELVYFDENFFSPYGLTDPSRFRSWRKDEFYLGAGALRYGPNMTGVNVKFEPEFNRGRLGVQYAQHRQVKEGNDVLFFNYRLNGRNMWESSNSWTKYNALFWADSGNAIASTYKNRVGTMAEDRKMYRQRGGLYGGTWELWESFVAYEDADQVKKGEVPQHTKWASYLAVDGGYDIGHWLHTDKNVMISGYAALSGVSTTFAPVAYSEEQSDMLLWSFFGILEPTVALFPSFHVVGHVGFENWKSEYGYVETVETLGGPGSLSTTDYGNLVPKNYSFYEKAPVDYYQTALGIGFDWDFADRAGLHFRYKWVTHTDNFISENDWTGHYITAETKVWF